jgi:hypothetical protein
MAVAAAAMFATPAMVGQSHVTEVRAAPAQAQPQQAPAPVDNKALREDRAARPYKTVRYSRGIPASIKNRAGGELAHRKWRKIKSSGRKAA